VEHGCRRGFLACNVATFISSWSVNSDRCNPSIMGSTNHARTLKRRISKIWSKVQEEYATCEE
jgi:hypothetical protein